MGRRRLSPDPVGVGFIGCGRVADNHARALGRCSHARLVAASGGSAEHPAVKIRIGSDLDDDIERIRQIRASVVPGFDIMTDAGQCCTDHPWSDFTAPIVVDKGTIGLPRAIGLGVRVDEDIESRFPFVEEGAAVDKESQRRSRVPSWVEI